LRAKNGGRTGLGGEKSSAGLNLGQKTGAHSKLLIFLGFSKRPAFLLTFFPQIRALGGEIVPLRKKFPLHVSQKLLILLTLPREAAAAVPL